MGEVFKRGEFLKIIGIGLYITILRVNALARLGSGSDTPEGPYLSAAAYIVGLVTLIILERAFGWNVGKKQVLAAGIIGSMSLLLPYLTEDLRIFSLLLSNVVFAVMTMFFGMVVASFRERLSGLALSLIVAVTVSAVTAGLLQLFFVDTPLIVLAILPLFTGFCLTRGDEPLMGAEPALARQEQRPTVVVLLATLLIGYVLCSILNGMAVKQFPLSTFEIMLMYILSALVVLSLLFFSRKTVLQAIVRASHRGKRRDERDGGIVGGRRMLEGLWPLSVVLLIFSLLCFTSVLPVKEELSYIMAFASLSAFYFGFLILVPVVVSTCGLPFIPAYGAFSIISYGLFWRNLGGRLFDMGVTSFSVGTIGTITVLFLLIGLLVAISRHIRRLSELVDTAQQDEIKVNGGQEVALAAITHLKGITTREQEVCRLLLQGYSAPKIASKLYVSESTVRFHMKNMYRKLGVHSKQELLDLLNGEYLFG